MKSTLQKFLTRAFSFCAASSRRRRERPGLILPVLLLSLSSLLAQTQPSAPGKSPATISSEPQTLSSFEDAQRGNGLSQWRDLTPTFARSVTRPAAGEDCAMLYDPVNRRIILYGGKDDEDNNVNDLWALDLARHELEAIPAENEGPPASEDHSAIYDPLGRRMIVYGGENGLTTNQTWSFDFAARRWRNITAADAPAREDHSAIYDSRGKRMVVFGGRNNDGKDDYINIHEVWTLDLDPQSATFERWQNLTDEERHPQGRSDHAVVYDSLRNRMVIFGGWDKEKKEPLKDTWAFYFHDSTKGSNFWRQIKTKYSHPPERRHVTGLHDASRNCFIIFGGFGNDGYLNDVWALNLKTDIWINITPGPQPRLDHQVVFDPTSKRLLLYGGDARLDRKFHDVWELQIDPDLSLEQLEEAATTKVMKSSKKKKK